jgi:hypothetical protein
VLELKTKISQHTSVSFTPSIAFSASSRLENKTNAIPLLFRVSFSLTIVTLKLNNFKLDKVNACQ